MPKLQKKTVLGQLAEGFFRLGMRYALWRCAISEPVQKAIMEDGVRWLDEDDPPLG